MLHARICWIKKFPANFTCKTKLAIYSWIKDISELYADIIQCFTMQEQPIDHIKEFLNWENDKTSLKKKTKKTMYWNSIRYIETVTFLIYILTTTCRKYKFFRILFFLHII